MNSASYNPTLAVAVLPSEKFTVTTKLEPPMNKPLGNVALKKFAAKILKLASAVSGKFTLPFAPFSNAVSNPLVTPSTQNPLTATVSQIPMGPVRVRLIEVTVRLPLLGNNVTVKVPSNCPSGARKLAPSPCPTRSRTSPSKLRLTLGPPDAVV